MKNLLFMLLIATATMLAACGKDESAKTPGAAAPAANAMKDTMKEKAATTVAAATEKMDAMSAKATTTIDHTKDTIEFELKRHLAGLESLLEDIKDSDEVARIKKEIAETQAKLDAM